MKTLQKRVDEAKREAAYHLKEVQWLKTLAAHEQEILEGLAVNGLKVVEVDDFDSDMDFPHKHDYAVVSNVYLKDRGHLREWPSGNVIQENWNDDKEFDCVGDGGASPVEAAVSALNEVLRELGADSKIEDKWSSQKPFLIMAIATYHHSDSQSLMVVGEFVSTEEANSKIIAMANANEFHESEDGGGTRFSRVDEDSYVEVGGNYFIYPGAGINSDYNTPEEVVKKLEPY